MTRVAIPIQVPGNLAKGRHILCKTSPIGITALAFLWDGEDLTIEGCGVGESISEAMCDCMDVLLHGENAEAWRGTIWHDKVREHRSRIAN